MQIKRFGTATEIDNGEKVVLFSYSTPVAVLIKGEGYYRTDARWSNTTSRHIARWLDGVQAKTVSQKEIERLARS